MSDQHSDQDMDSEDLSPDETKLLDRSDSMRPGEELDAGKREREANIEQTDEYRDHFSTTINIRSTTNVDDEGYDYEARRTMIATNDSEHWRRERETQKPIDEDPDSPEEERIIRLPSENDITDVSDISPKFSDCLNFNQQDRELVYLKHAEIFENWKYSDEERAFLRHRVETFSREQSIIHCILGHMLMTPDEMVGVRQTGLKPDDARQALLCLAIGSHWDVYNLAIIMAFSEKLNVDSCVNRMYQGVDPMFASGVEFRSRVTLYFARCLLEE